MGPGSDKILESLRVKKEQLGLTNIELKPNLSRRELRELLGKAMFYLHPEFPEHFGISVVEAMSAGCVPIVYRDGGAWYDLVSRISSTLSYISIKEVPEIINVLEKNRNLYEKLREISIEVSKNFNYENFRSNLVEKVNYVLKIKKLQ
jgi:glycosyltransferase involved in cell wall biosynthesis